MTNKASMCILFRDETVEVVFIDRTVLGTQIKFMERLPRNDEVFEAVAERMRSVEKTPGRVLLCLPRELAIQRTLRYPAGVQADLAGMIQFEATRHVPFPEADRSLAWAALPSPDEKQVVLNLVAARAADIGALISRFEEAGVPVDEAIPFSTALFPMLGNRPTLLVVSDVRKIELCLYGEGQLQDSQVLMLDAPGYSPERVVTAARQMTAKHKDWLGMEGVGRVILAGPEPLEADLDTAFGLRVQPLEVPEGFGAPEDPLVDVLAAVSTELPPELNLIEQSGRKVPISKRTILISALCALLVVELLAWFAFKTGAPALQRRQVAEEMARVRRRAAPIQRMKDKNREMRKQLYRLDEICNRHVSTMEVLRVLSEALPEDSYLRSINYRDGGIRLQGYSKEPERLPELLQAVPMVDAISKSDIGKKNGDYTDFTISLTLRLSDEDSEI